MKKCKVVLRGPSGLPGGSVVKKICLADQEMRVASLGQGDLLE